MQKAELSIIKGPFCRSLPMTSKAFTAWWRVLQDCIETKEKKHTLSLIVLRSPSLYQFHQWAFSNKDRQMKICFIQYFVCCHLGHFYQSPVFLFRIQNSKHFYLSFFHFLISLLKIKNNMGIKINSPLPCSLASKKNIMK